MVLLSPPEEEFLRQVAGRVQRRGLQGPAVLALQVGQPLMLVAGQLLWIAQPALSLAWSSQRVAQLAQLLERPGTADVLLALLNEDG
jgi:hypothetical protein